MRKKELLGLLALLMAFSVDGCKAETTDEQTS